MARLFADENFSHPIVRELRALGHEVTTVQDLGRANQRWPDDEVLRHASGEGRAVLTHNRRHFFRLHRMQPNHAGIIACTVTPDFAAMAQRIHDEIRRRTSLACELIRIYRSEH